MTSNRLAQGALWTAIAAVLRGHQRRLVSGGSVIILPKYVCHAIPVAGRHGRFKLSSRGGSLEPFIRVAAVG